MTDGHVNKTIVLGLGNVLLSDDAVGVRVVERLQQRYTFPPQVQVLDGGTLGLDLLPYLEGDGCLLVVDAVDIGANPGTVVRLEGEEVPAFFGANISPHQMGLADLLAAARLTGVYPEELVLWGVQPETIDVRLALSPSVAAQLETLVDKVLAELDRWGIEPTGT